MATFEYTALDGNGAAVRGVLSAASEAGVLGELEARRLTPVAVSEKRSATKGRGRVSTAALANAYGQLADLLTAGVPLSRTLTLMSKQKKRPKLAAAFAEILQIVQDGGEMSVGMERVPRHLGKREQPRKSPERPCRMTIGAPHSWHL